MSIRAVIFDFGGVLVTMVDDRPRMELAEQLQLPLPRLDELIFFSESAQQASRGQISVVKHWQTVGEALGISLSDMPEFLNKYWSADEVNWKLLEFIKGLRPRYKVGLLSNAWDDLRQTIHERWNIDGLFDEMIISAEVKLVKPDPRIFHLAVQRLGVQPGEAVFIDDIAENISAAQREGLTAIQYLNLAQIMAELERILPTV